MDHNLQNFKTMTYFDGTEIETLPQLLQPQPHDGFVIDRMRHPCRLITLIRDRKPIITVIDFTQFHEYREALINDINYEYFREELGFYEIFHEITTMEILISKQSRILHNYITTKFDEIESLSRKARIVRFRTIFDETNDEFYISRIDMITYHNEMITIHNLKAWQHITIFNLIAKHFIIKDKEIFDKPGIIHQNLITNAILIPKNIYILRKIPRLNEDVISIITKFLD